MSTPSRSYRTVRWVAKEISETWFREHGAIETDNIPEEGGVLFAAWHPGSLIDPLVMISTLPGQITFIAKHTLFKVPILGKVMKAAGARPIYRSIDKEHIEGDRKKGNQAVINTVSDILVDQGRCVIFPEGTFYSQRRFAASLAEIEKTDSERFLRVKNLRNVLPVRTGGILALLNSTPDADLVVIGHSGFERFSSFRDIFRNVPFTSPIKVTLRRIAHTEIPADDKNRVRFLDEQWQGIDLWNEEIIQFS